MLMHERPLCFICVLSFFFRTTLSEVTERNSTDLCHMFAKKLYFTRGVQKGGFRSRKRQAPKLGGRKISVQINLKETVGER